MTNGTKVANTKPNMTPLSPKKRVAGIPTTSEITHAAAEALKMESGDCNAFRAIDGPPSALPKMDPRAIQGSSLAAPKYLPP